MRIRDLMMGLILVAVPLSSYLLVFGPQNKRIAESRAEIAHKRELLQQLQIETARNNDLMRANEEIAALIKQTEARLPDGKEVDNIVRQISELAVTSGLASPAVESGKPVAAAMYMEQPLKIVTNGDFRGFYEFLLQLERLPRITRLPDMAIERASDVDGNIKATFTLSIYFTNSRAN
ncbi:type IV pilus inner membrane component PilO [Nodularia spumigena]|uniref:type 4a pilus biogenesis protein PilO n=1 Tax=Nodularia spumigena TaxID=70799 RepID=UPI002B1EFC31|nr:type 4a pilus biogenesis protein PilO [Nodularia spumigena]MEA5557670.1 type 4a pilus biogenesis protein PilO [Nodularia spumigena CH309]